MLQNSLNQGQVKASTHQDSADQAFKKLIDLDSKFRSQRLGTQLQAISLFPQLFDEHPFPVIINSGVLKLADFFRNSHNSVRFFIVKVFRKSEHHHKKILNVVELIRRFLPVLQSNDPVARSLTVRVLGSIHSIASERLDVQHGILECLNSEDRMELEAAIFASDRFCAVSKTFPKLVSNKLAILLQDSRKPLNIKIHILRVLRHMHHSNDLVIQTRSTCEAMLNQHTEPKLISVLLQTLSNLAIKAPLYLEAHVDMLFDYVTNNPRRILKRYALHEIIHLMKNNWRPTRQHIERLVDLARNTDDEHLQKTYLTIFQIESTESRYAIVPESISLMRSFVGTFLDHRSDELRLRAAQIISVLVAKEPSNHPSMETDEDHTLISKAITSLCALLREFSQAEDESTRSTKKIQMLFKCLSDLIQSKPEFVEKVIDTLVNVIPEANENLLRLCQGSLSTLAANFPQNILNRYDQIFSLLEASSQVRECPHKFLLLSKTLIQAGGGVDYNLITAQLPTFVHMCINYEKESPNHPEISWVLYLIAKEAAKNGSFEGVSELCQFLVSKVESESSRLWLESLYYIATAECKCHAIQERSDLPEMLNWLYKSQSNLKALNSIDNTHSFQMWVIHVRLTFLEWAEDIMVYLELLQQNPDDPLYKRNLVQMAATMKQLSHSYQFLAHCFFDIDSESLSILELYCICCAILSLCLSKLTGNSRDIELEARLIPLINQIRQPERVETQFFSAKHLFKSCVQALSKSHPNLIESGGDDELDTKTTLECLLVLLNTPMPLPAYFFRSKSLIEIQMSTTPSLNSNDPYMIKKGNMLILDIEGFTNVEKGLEERLNRTVSSILITVFTSQQEIDFGKDHFEQKMAMSLQATACNDSDSKPSQKGGHSRMMHHVQVSGSYFTCSTAIPVPSLESGKSIFYVNIQCAITDKHGESWYTGPDLSYPVKVI
ncbi:hypothetical protein K493DRAFT_48154 [Basidiobolus meristosporus CBS 931.73]|uniref:Integrator complex subunit 7 n=1 Tax=Basidiobolus meristosporus CBS 931.73 TaxID=1314790 RepID=A0A1Y1Y1C8_9FUNG|nr:hypothetical protein K493DRAFT_48154 [Basidiobolus meristosporus CBS 931.73]|eukprot:ORX91810.1 hypothetical protein K493DRAFT_48154 [Basidiobolus meristosporus CBS 931.73]